MSGHEWHARAATQSRGFLAWSVLAVLIGLVLAAGCTSVTGGPPSGASTGSTLSIRGEVAHDTAFVARKYHNCAAFRLTPSRCPMQVATTPNGKGGDLIAVDLTQQTGDDCYRGRVFFFAAQRFLASTNRLTPHSFGGVEAVRADGTAAFMVIYGVSASANSSCAMNGSAGTDDYVYAWNGTRMVLKSGTPPTLPKVIVGT